MIKKVIGSRNLHSVTISRVIITVLKLHNELSSIARRFFYNAKCLFFGKLSSVGKGSQTLTLPFVLAQNLTMSRATNEVGGVKI